MLGTFFPPWAFTRVSPAPCLTSPGRGFNPETDLLKVVPATLQYAIGTPFFDTITLDLPVSSRPLKIAAKGAGGARKKYIKNVKMDDLDWGHIVFDHKMIADGRDIVFEMSDTPQAWGQ